MAFLMIFTVPKEWQAAFIEDYERIRGLLSRQPGSIRSRLHGGLQELTVLFTCTGWESEDYFRKPYAARDVEEVHRGLQAVPSMRTIGLQRDGILIGKRPS